MRVFTVYQNLLKPSPLTQLSVFVSFGSHLQAMDKTNTSAARQFGSLTDTVTANNLTLAVTPNKVTMICSLLQGEGTDSAGNSASRSGQKVQQHCAK